MRQKIILITVLLFVILVGFLSISFVKKYRVNKQQEQLLASLPTFYLKDLEGNLFTNKNLPQSKWIVFVFFNSECQYCQSEAEQLRDLNEIPTNISFVWVSSEPKEIIAAFQLQYRLQKIHFLYDSDHLVADQWGVSTIPKLLVYTPQGALFKNHVGVYRIDRLIAQIQTHESQKN